MAVGFSYSIPVPGYASLEDGTVVALKNNTCPSGNLTQGTCGTYSQPVSDTPTSTSAAAPAFWVSSPAYEARSPARLRRLLGYPSRFHGGFPAILQEHFSLFYRYNPRHKNQLVVKPLTCPKSLMVDIMGPSSMSILKPKTPKRYLAPVT